MYISKKAEHWNSNVIIGNCRLVIESEVLASTKEMRTFTERSEKSHET